MHRSPTIELDTSTTVEQLLAHARARLQRFTAEQAFVAMRDGAQPVDSRSDSQRATDGVIPGAVSVARNVLEWRLDPAYERHVVKVPAKVDVLDAAPLSCAGVTVYKAVKSSDVGPSQLCAVFGVGGLGHLAVQYAKIQGATVVAVDLEDDKLEMAKDLGADYVINAGEQDPATEIQALGGADAAIALAVAHRPFEQAFDSLARGGTLMMVALPPDNYVKLPIFETVLRGINIKGSIVGTHRDVEDVFTLHTLGRTRVLRETRPLEEVNEAFDDVEHARNKAPRLVFTV